MDVDLETMAPKIDLLENLVTSKTVALLLAHIYGKWFDIGPFLSVAKRHNLKVGSELFLSYFVCVFMVW